MRYGLNDKTIEKISGVFRKYPQIHKAILFGSRALGNYKNGSDIDLTFIGEGLSLTILNKISNDLDDLLLPYSFDLSIFNDLTNKDFIDQINRVGVVFFLA